MRGAITDVIDARAKDDGGLTRLFGYSLAIHLIVFVGAVLIPSNWLSSEPVKPNVIEVSLGGSFGEKTTGVAPIAGRRVEQAVPGPAAPGTGQAGTATKTRRNADADQGRPSSKGPREGA